MKLETDVGDGVVEDEQEDEDAQHLARTRLVRLSRGMKMQSFGIYLASTRLVTAFAKLNCLEPLHFEISSLVRFKY